MAWEGGVGVWGCGGLRRCIKFQSVLSFRSHQLNLDMCLMLLLMGQTGGWEVGDKEKKQTDGKRDRNK